MNEYLERLRSCLERGGLPSEEIENAISYYQEVFFDAGLSNERETAEKLGSPETLAREILFENGIHADGRADFQIEDVVRTGESYNGTGNNGYFDDGPFTFVKGTYRSHANNLLLKIIVLLVTSPIWISVLSVAVSTAFTVIAVVLAVIIALIVAGFGCLIGGFVTLLSVPPVGVCLIGVGFILLGLCGVTVIPLIKLIWKGCVACLNGAVRAVRCFFGIGGDR